jgi:hypothetical protein
LWRSSLGRLFPMNILMRHVIARTMSAISDGLGSVDGTSSPTDSVIIAILLDSRISLEVLQTEPAVAYLLFYLHCSHLR